MNKISKILTAVIIFITAYFGSASAGFLDNHASAIMLTSCQHFIDTNTSVSDLCSSFNVSLGGVGQMRAWADCKIAGYNGMVDYAGPWVGLNQRSWVSCPSGWYVWIAAYELR